jgi:pimeloyl-ACP methyl ester carboxylesterase
MLTPTTREVRSFDGTAVQWIEMGRGYPLLVSSPLGIPIGYWDDLFGRLADSYRICFVKRRGLWGAPIPGDLAHMDVEAHARDLTAVVEATGHRAFAMLGFCSGVAPMMRSLELAARLPERVAVFSGRFCPGKPVGGSRWFHEVKKSDRIRERVIDVLTRFAPASLRAGLTQELLDPGQLDAHLAAVETSRAYDVVTRIPAGVPTTFHYSERDYDEIKQSTNEFAARAGLGQAAVVEIPGAHHFSLCEDPAPSAERVRALFGT